MNRNVGVVAGAIGAAGLVLLFGAAPAFAQAVPQASHDLSVTLPFGLPVVKARTILVGIHLLGLCLGVGGVLVLDGLLAKALMRGVFYAHNRALVRILSKTTGAGLSILWISGLTILALYSRDHPELLNNPKLYAKVIIVAALTVNGWLVDRFCEPLIEADGDAPLLVSFTPAMQVIGIFCGVASAVSWYAASILGVVRELNNVVPASTIIACWAAAVTVCFLGAIVIGAFINHKNATLSPAQRAGWREETLSFDDIRRRLAGGGAVRN